MKLLILLILVQRIDGFSPNQCDNSVSQVIFSNGFQIFTGDASTDSLLTSTSSEIDGLTYRQALDFATSSVRNLLRNFTVNDKPYLATMQNVPFRIQTVENGQHFFYSGKCDLGCVVTELPARLIRDIYNTPTLFIHEYAHVYELAIPAHRADVDSAYDNFMNNVFPSLQSQYSSHPYNEQDYGNWFWYAAANENEYFAVTSEAFFTRNSLGQPNIYKWPYNATYFETEDPVGYEAVRQLWSLDENSIDNAIASCASYYPNFSLGLLEIVGIALGGVLILLTILYGCYACCIKKK